MNCCQHIISEKGQSGFKNNWKTLNLYKNPRCLKDPSPIKGGRTEHSYIQWRIRERIYSCSLRTSCVWGWQHYCSIDYVEVYTCTFESSEHSLIRAFGRTHRITIINKTSLLYTQDSYNGVTYWVDSMNVGYWIQGQSREYKLFIAHRVGEIHKLYAPNQW